MAILQEQMIDLPGQKLHVIKGGSGPPLLLLHGGGLDSARLSWGEVMEPLARTHTVYAPDWPGYGESEPLSGHYTLDALADVLEHLIEMLILERVRLMGISMGGGAALSYALRHPARVEKLVLVDSYGLAERAPFHWISHWVVQMPWLSRWIYRSMRRSRTLTRWGLRSIFAGPVPEAVVDDTVQALRLPHAGAPFISFQQHEVLNQRLRTCYRDQLHTLTMPVLLVHGAKDTLVPLSAAQEAVQLLPNGELVVLPRTGHWPPRERPRDFLQAVEPFLDRSR